MGGIPVQKPFAVMALLSALFLVGCVAEPTVTVPATEPVTAETTAVTESTTVAAETTVTETAATTEPTVTAPTATETAATTEPTVTAPTKSQTAKPTSDTRPTSPPTLPVVFPTWQSTVSTTKATVPRTKMSVDRNYVKDDIYFRTENLNGDVGTYYVGDEKTVYLTPERVTVDGSWPMFKPKIPPYVNLKQMFGDTPVETVVITDGIDISDGPYLTGSDDFHVRHVYLLQKNWAGTERSVRRTVIGLLANVTSMYWDAEDEDVYHLYLLKDSEYLKNMDAGRWQFCEERTVLNGPVGTVTMLSYKHYDRIHRVAIHVIDENDPIYAGMPGN